MTPEWHTSDDTALLDARRVFPVPVIVACWYDGPIANRFVCEAEYWGRDCGMRWGRRGGGSLGACVVTHWDWLPEPPPEADMLAEALKGIGAAW